MTDPAHLRQAIALYQEGCLAAREGRMAEAIGLYRQSVDVFPLIDAYSNLITTMSVMSEYGPEEVFAVAKDCGVFLEASWPEPEFIRDRDPDRKIEIAYLTAALGQDIMLPYIGVVLMNHDREKFGIHTYSGGMDDALFDRVAEDKIDIFINPIGHWMHNRLAVFARKPAPIQVSYLCQSLTTGLTRMDYVIADGWLDLDLKMQKYATEKVVHLKSGFQVTTILSEPEIGAPPSENNGFITFASFNNPRKISTETIKLWTDVLTAVPGSNLLIQGMNLDDAGVQNTLRERIDFDPDRIAIQGQVPGDNDVYLLEYNKADIILDTTPFSGGQTTLDALWMGVPVVTLVGDAVYGRFSYSHLMRIGSPGWAAKNEYDYVIIAQALAESPTTLQAARKYLRPTMKTSSILDGALHTRELEDAYRTMWRKWCSDG